VIWKPSSAAVILAWAVLLLPIPARPTLGDAPQHAGQLPPNTLGRIPILEYHVIGNHEARFTVDRGHFRRDLEFMYARGYRPVNVSDLLARKIDLPAGMSPVVFTFDDASPSQFRYIERNGELVIDSTSAIGIWIDFQRTHPDWGNKATFCLLSGANAGHNFFGYTGVDGQKTAWRFKKVRWLAEHGFELCNHTLWHAQLSKYSDGVVQEQIARGQLAIDSAVPSNKVVTFCLPLGAWPKTRSLAWKGSWTNPKTGKTLAYDYAAVLEVAGGPARSPFDPKWDPHSIPRVEVYANELEKEIEKLDRAGDRYVAPGSGGE
jgi:peptidoglycan/xylan/chitin deacetylase (PgdA/CDA1 family)